MTIIALSLSLPAAYLGAQDVIPYHACSECHLPDSWTSISEEAQKIHENTGMPLRVKHALAQCIQCHSRNISKTNHDFLKVKKECAACHFDIHQGEFGFDCGLCHSYNNWEMADWRKNHDQTLFDLTGAHFMLECSDCHKPMLTGQGEFLSTECVSCHQDTLNEAILQGHTNNRDCIVCHNTLSWLPTDMSSHDLLFPIYSGKHGGEWSSCDAECHIYAPDYTRFSCGLNGICHEHDRNEMDEKHREETSDYIYESTACLDCHPEGNE